MGCDILAGHGTDRAPGAHAHGLWNRPPVQCLLRGAWLAAWLAVFTTVSAHAQVITGTLMEAGSDHPISLGLVIIATADGDSITSDVTDSAGRFRVESPNPGEFFLIASAFGFKESRAGLFVLEAKDAIDVQFRVGAKAMPIEGILVELQRPAIEHELVRNGFVRRLQRGLGMFITPYDLEHSTAMSSADLLRGIPGVSIRTTGGGTRAHNGENLQFLASTGYCTPTLYVDGVQMDPRFVASLSTEELFALELIEAVEIYRRPSEVPIEYGALGSGLEGETRACGVMVVWTKHR